MQIIMKDGPETCAELKDRYNVGVYAQDLRKKSSLAGKREKKWGAKHLENLLLELVDLPYTNFCLVVRIDLIGMLMLLRASRNGELDFAKAMPISFNEHFCQIDQIKSDIASRVYKTLSEEMMAKFISIASDISEAQRYMN